MALTLAFGVRDTPCAQDTATIARCMRRCRRDHRMTVFATSKHGSARRPASRIGSRVPKTRVGRLLARLARPDEPAPVRVAALSSIVFPMRCDMAAHGPEWIYARTIARALRAPESEVVAAALGAYASADDPMGSRLPLLLRDPRPGVRAGALEALQSRDVRADAPRKARVARAVACRTRGRACKRSPIGVTTFELTRSAGSLSATSAGYDVRMQFSLRSLRLLGATASLVGLGTFAVPGAAGAAVAGAPSNATLSAGTHDFTTTLSPLWVGGGSYVGVLELRVANDGSISGFFRNNDVGEFHQITGGVRGSDVWLDLGTIAGGRPFNGTYRDGQIHGGIYAGGQPYEFLAAPSPAISGDAGAITPTSPR